MTEAKDVWIVAEYLTGKIEDVTLEMIGEGRRLVQKLGQQTCVILIGYQKEPPLKLFSSHGVDRLYVVNDPLLTDYTANAYATALIELIEGKQPSVVIFAATANSGELAATVAARLQVGLVSGCTALKINDADMLEATRPVYQEKIYSTVVFQADVFPRLATIKPGSIGIEKGELSTQTQIETVRPLLKAEDIKLKVLGYAQADARTLDLTEAEIIVAGGHGISFKDNWHLVEELAELLGGAIGGSRVAMDDGWITREQLIGQSGKTVKPSLFLAMGISGASHHTEGMKESERIIVINKDKAAPFFKLANLSIVGDLTQVVPALISKLRQIKQSTKDSE
jgi:electron transfer flavoprotein alpha subunit